MGDDEPEKGDSIENEHIVKSENETTEEPVEVEERRKDSEELPTEDVDAETESEKPLPSAQSSNDEDSDNRERTDENTTENTKSFERNEIVTQPLFLEKTPQMPLKLLPTYRKTPKQFPQMREWDLSVVRERRNFVSPICITILLTGVIVCYLIGGSRLFSFLEEKQEMAYIEKLSRLKNDTAILLATELRQVKANEPIWARYVFKYLDFYEDELLKASGVGYWRKDQIKRRQRWSKRNSFFYSLALMTTTGYGSMTPRSDWGRTATVCYSLLGVPLMIAWLIFFGHFLALFWCWMFKNLCCQFCNTNKKNETEKSVPTGRIKKIIQTRPNSVAPIKEDIKSLVPRNSRRESDPKSHRASNNTTGTFPARYSSEQNNSQVFRAIYECNSLIPAPKSKLVQMDTDVERKLSDLDHAVATVFSVIFFLVYYVFGSVVLAVMEDWKITDSLYFNFLMLMTLGPGCNELESDISEIEIKQNALYIAFLGFGYCIMSMIFNLVFMISWSYKPKRNAQFKKTRALGSRNKNLKYN